MPLSHILLTAETFLLWLWLLLQFVSISPLHILINLPVSQHAPRRLLFREFAFFQLDVPQSTRLGLFHTTISGVHIPTTLRVANDHVVPATGL